MDRNKLEEIKQEAEDTTHHILTQSSAAIDEVLGHGYSLKNPSLLGAVVESHTALYVALINS